MRRAIPLLLAALLLARVAPALADLPDELARTQRTLEAAEQRLAGGRTELQRRAAMHDHLVARIEELKRGPIQSFRLEALQRSARTMAEERSMLQQRVTQAEQEIVRLRSLLQQRAQQQLSSLQARQPDDAGDKLRWMQQQQELLALLRRLEPQGGIETLPTMPQGVVRSSDGPEELRELADEMADVAEKYMAHAASLARRIQELLQQQRLSKLAEDLAREQGLFDEDVRYRKVTRYSQVPRPGGTAAAAASGQGRQGQPRQPAATGDEAPANGAKTTGEGLPPAPPAQPPGALPADEAEDDGSWHNGASGQGEYGGDADNDPGADSFARDGDGVLDPAIAPALPEDVAQPGALDGFDDPARSFSPPPAFEARVGIKDDLDPDLGMRCEQPLDTLSVATQLSLLQQQRLEAERRGQQLLRNAGSLRQKAQTMERAEGF